MAGKTKRIKLLQSCAHPRRGYQINEVVDWPDAADAQRMIDRGVAEASTADVTYPELADLNRQVVTQAELDADKDRRAGKGKREAAAVDPGETPEEPAPAKGGKGGGRRRGTRRTGRS